jgi:sugar/nucleoside kinase (ribokinase family)
VKRSRRAEPQLVVFGEFFFDLVFYDLPTTPKLGEEVKTNHFFVAPGGGVATTSIAAQKLGTHTAIVTRVGVDALSNPAWQLIESCGVDTSACEIRKDFPSALTACISYNGDRMMVTHDAINRDLEDLLRKPAVRKLLKSARHVHFGCMFRDLKRWGALLEQLRRGGVTISADLGWNPDLDVNGVLHLLRGSMFLFPNEVEARMLTRTDSPEAAARALTQWIKYPVVKIGTRGSLMITEDGLLHVPAIDVNVCDTTGAGDAFNGGFLHAWLSGYGWRECLLAGNICGGYATTAAGGSAGLPNRRRFREAMRSAKYEVTSSRS